MPDCTYKAENIKERTCTGRATETLCDGQFFCSINGNCVLSVPCAQMMMFDATQLNTRILCHGVEVYPFPVSTTPIDVSTKNEDNVVNDDPSTTRMSQADRNSPASVSVVRVSQAVKTPTTPISLVRQSTEVLPSQTPWPSAQTTMEKNTLTSTTETLPHGLTPGLLGGSIGGILALLVVVLIVTVAIKRYRNRKTDKKTDRERISFQRKQDQITIRSVVNVQEPEEENSPLSVHGQFCNRSEEHPYVSDSSNNPQNQLYTSLSDNRSDSHVYDQVKKSSQQYMSMTSTVIREGLYIFTSENRNDTSVYDTIGN